MSWKRVGLALGVAVTAVGLIDGVSGTQRGWYTACVGVIAVLSVWATDRLRKNRDK